MFFKELRNLTIVRAVLCPHRQSRFDINLFGLFPKSLKSYYASISLQDPIVETVAWLLCELKQYTCSTLIYKHVKKETLERVFIILLYMSPMILSGHNYRIFHHSSP